MTTKCIYSQGPRSPSLPLRNFRMGLYQIPCRNYPDAGVKDGIDGGKWQEWFLNGKLLGISHANPPQAFLSHYGLWVGLKFTTLVNGWDSFLPPWYRFYHPSKWIAKDLMHVIGFQPPLGKVEGSFADYMCRPISLLLQETLNIHLSQK